MVPARGPGALVGMVHQTLGLVMLCWMIVALPTLAALHGFTQDRVVSLQALQNRLAASMKKG